MPGTIPPRQIVTSGHGRAPQAPLAPFLRLARTLRAHHDGILAAIRLGLSNGRLEGLNSKIRLISHRSYGFCSPDALIALVYPVPPITRALAAAKRASPRT